MRFGKPHATHLIDHIRAELPFRFENDFFRNARFFTTLTVLRPAFRQIQAPAEYRAALFSNMVQADRNLAIPHLAERSRILSFHSHRVLALLGEARIVDHPNRVRLQFRRHALTQTFPQRHPLPRALSNELLKSLYVSLVRAIGKWLDGLAFPIQQKSTNVNRTPVPSFAPAHGLQQILQELFQAFSAFLNLGIRHACDGSTSKTIRQQLNVVILGVLQHTADGRDHLLKL